MKHYNGYMGSMEKNKTQGQVYNVSIWRMYLGLLAEFGGKGERQLTIADSRWQTKNSRCKQSGCKFTVFYSGDVVEMGVKGNDL